MAKEIQPAGTRYDVVLWTEQAGQMARGGVWLEGFAQRSDAEKYCADANRMVRSQGPTARRAEYRVEEREANYREKRYGAQPVAEEVEA